MSENIINIQMKALSFDKDLKLDMNVDRDKFTDEFATELNSFWSGADDRISEAGSVFKAALKLVAGQIFQQTAFNNFCNAASVHRCFDWKVNGGGIEGFPSFEDMGITVNRVDNLHIEEEDLEFITRLEDDDDDQS